MQLRIVCILYVLSLNLWKLISLINIPVKEFDMIYISIIYSVMFIVSSLIIIILNIKKDNLYSFVDLLVIENIVIVISLIICEEYLNISSLGLWRFAIIGNLPELVVNCTIMFLIIMYKNKKELSDESFLIVIENPKKVKKDKR